MINNTTPTAKPKGSISGFVLAVLSLILSAIGSGLVHAHFNGTKPATTTVEKAGGAVANGTVHVVSTLVAMPFLVVGFALAVFAVILVVVRLRKKLKAGGLLFSVVSLLLSIWSFGLVIGAFSLIKAH
ncbi:MAG: hypothetical protein WC498_00990 [Candidatus Saccharimonadales bacterium]